MRTRKREKQEKAAKELEEEKARAATKKETEGIVDKEKKLHIEESKHMEMMDVGTDLFKEANAKLKKVLKTKDMKQIAVA